MNNKIENSESERQALALVVQQHYGKLLALLIKDLRDFQLAEDSLQDAIESALVHWQRSGLPNSPTAWLLQTARRKAIDRLRRLKTFKGKSAELSYLMDIEQQQTDTSESYAIPDERLRLIFTCCHPALDPHTAAALSLRTLCGLSTPEIARAFVVGEEAMAQRLVRARQKISKAGIVYEVPEPPNLLSRLEAVLNTIYLTFNAGYGAIQHRIDLCEEAIRLARMVKDLCPDQPEAAGLLALLLLTHSRRNARISSNSVYIPLELQDRIMWDQAMIDEGEVILVAALKAKQVGRYQLQASVSAIHAEAKSHEETHWGEIVQLYSKLYDHTENAVYLLNRAVALSFRDNPSSALRAMEEISIELQNYQPYHAARADFLRRAGNFEEARLAYELAISLSKNTIEQNYLTQMRASLLS